MRHPSCRRELLLCGVSRRNESGWQASIVRRGTAYIEIDRRDIFWFRAAWKLDALRFSTPAVTLITGTNDAVLERYRESLCSRRCSNIWARPEPKPCRS